jgi:lysozyme
MFGYFKKKAKTNDEPDELKHMVDYANYTDMKNMKDDVGVTHELREALQSKLKKEEGLHLQSYECPTGYQSIGYGRNIEQVGIKKAEAEMLLQNDMEDIFLLLDKHIPMWKYENFNVRLVLCDMCYNLGIKGLLKFKKFLNAVDESDYEEAALELKKSKYFTQVPNRAKRNIELVLSVI